MPHVANAVAPPLGSCSLTLLKQHSKRSPCTPDVTFGCKPGRAQEFWVSGGCRGLFRCGQRKVTCGDWRNREMKCACETVFEAHKLKRLSIHNSPPSPFSLLIALVADSSERTQRRTLTSMQHVDSTHATHRARLDWAVVTYDDQAERWEGTRLATRQLSTVRLLLVLNASSGREQPLDKSQRKARWAHQTLLLRTLWQSAGTKTYRHDAVWLPDDDLSFVGFDLAEFIRRYQCALPNGPPIITQPPLRAEAKQDTFSGATLPGGHKANLGGLTKPFQNDGRTYGTCVIGELSTLPAFRTDPCFLQHTLALRTQFVEGQAALLDAAFLRWLIERPLLQKVEKLQLKFGNEAGPDAVWCGAAKEWAGMQNATMPREACAVLTVPIAHANTKSLKAKNMLHVEGGFALLQAARIRRHLRDSLGDPPMCYRHNCSRHRWFRYQPAPNWQLPIDEEGLEQVKACAVMREDGAVGQCRSSASAVAPGCDGLFSLYWRSHEY